MPKKLDILRLFEDKELLTPFHLANLLDIKPNYARQIIFTTNKCFIYSPSGVAIFSSGLEKVTAPLGTSSETP